MAERIANIGYTALIKESTKGTALTPTTYVPLYEENLLTNLNIDEDTPIIGNKFARFQALMGQRSHKGEITVLAEPNTAARFFDMLMTKGTTTGAGPYTHPFTISGSTDPKSYTIDIVRGQVVFRFIGAEAEQISLDFQNNKMVFKIKISALKSLGVREIASVSTNAITLTTAYDPTPTDGFVTGDLVRIVKANGTVIDTTVSSVTSTVVNVASAGTAATGDVIFLRAATPSFTLVTPFLRARTEFRFAADATTALSGSQTRIDDASVAVMHKFNSEDGELRTGAFDPASLVRTVGDLEFTSKIFFDVPEDHNRFLALTKRACVIRSFSETGYELRITVNNMKQKSNEPPIKSNEVVYQEITWLPVYDTTDAQAFDVKVINNVSSI